VPRRQETTSLPASQDDIRSQLDRIFDYGGLQASVRRRRMLDYIVEETLAGRKTELKATTIAMAVFGRGADFNQQSDPIVRLEARKLRRDLDTYYAGAGRDDPIRISIPKGHYIPKFTTQQTARPDGHLRPEDPGNTGKRIPKPDTGFGLRIALIAIGSILVVAAVLVWTAQPEQHTPIGTTVSAGKVAILVEDFEARAGDDLVSLVASGLTHDIAAALIRFPDVAAYLTPDRTARGSELVAPAGKPPETKFAVTGNVWREGSKILIRAELIRRADLKVLWSERFTMGAQGQSITGIQDAISSKIASAVGQQYGYALRDIRTSQPAKPNDPGLRGFACVSSAQIYRRTYHRDEYQAVRECLEATVRDDPDYSRAWAMLAYLRNDAARFGHEKELSRDEAFDLAREAAMRAIDLDPQDTDALQAMSHVEQYAGRLERSIDFAHQAVEVNPNDPAALANLAIRYAIAGRFSEAVPVMNRAIDRSVAPPPFYYHVLAADHLIKKEWPDMLAAAERASADGWSFGQAMLAIAHNQLSNDRAAQEALKKMAELDPLLSDDPRTWLESHSMHAALVEAVVTGLSEVRTAVTE
jgi:TolB-like protein/Flp pilus assembly protein TadD